MADIKTKQTDADVSDFLNTVENEQKKKDGFKLLDIYKRLTGEEPKMWGPSIVGFGKYHYKSERSNQEGEWMLAGFSPRKQSLSIYLMMSGMEASKDLLGKLGKHKVGMGCLYINKLDDVDMAVLEDLIKKSYVLMKNKHS